MRTDQMGRLIPPLNDGDSYMKNDHLYLTFYVTRPEPETTDSYWSVLVARGMQVNGKPRPMDTEPYRDVTAEELLDVIAAIISENHEVAVQGTLFPGES